MPLTSQMPKTPKTFATHSRGVYPKAAQGYFTKWRMHPSDRKDVAGQLFSDYVETYEIWLQSQADHLKIERSVELQDKRVLRALKARANKEAAGITRTYNRELRSKILSLYNTPSATLSDQVIETWWVERDAYKADQIALMTEMMGQGLAATDFVKRNTPYLKGTAKPFPPGSDEPLCQALLAKSYTLEEAKQIILPLHVGCVHSWQFSYAPIKPQDFDKIWLGESKTPQQVDHAFDFDLKLFHPGHPDQKAHSGGAFPNYANPSEFRAARKKALAKIAAAPLPPHEKAVAARENLLTSKRAGGDGRGGSPARRQRRIALFKEFGGEKKGYVVDYETGEKLHYSKDPKVNPKGYKVFEQGKIFIKHQGGGYSMPNLLPESYATNRSRNDFPIRKGNLDDYKKDLPKGWKAER